MEKSHEVVQGAQAGEFQREDRYIVIKRKDLEKAPTLMAYALQVALDGLREHLPERQCLVIEGDWPEFEPTWAAIQARVEGRAALATQPAASEPVEVIATLQVHDYFPDSSMSRPDLHFLWAISPERQRELVRTMEEPIKLVALSVPPAAAHGDEEVRVDARLLELYQAPFRFDERGGYIWDAQNNMVADNHVEGDQAMRVRGWGRLSYRPDGEEVQDLMGQAMADALTASWNAAMRAQAGEGGEV